MRPDLCHHPIARRNRCAIACDGRCHGFTLIELSIVLVVIGLVIGGILVGRDLIHTAELRSVITQLEKYDTAIMAFKNKYNCLPGDCPNAAEFGLSDAACPAAPSPCDPNGTIADAGCNGDGNGRLDAAYCSEALEFWNHMARANLVVGAFDGKTLSAGSFTNRGPVFGISSPRTNLRGVGFAALYGSALAGTDTYYVVGISYPLPPSAASVLRNSEGYYLDSKIDDGLPYGGRLWKTFGCTTGANQVYDMADAMLPEPFCIITIDIPGYAD